VVRVGRSRRIQRSALPAQFTISTNEVIPLLRKLGLFRSEYRDETLRDRLGLAPVGGRFDPPTQQQRSA
jgi:hypothetical protein